VVPFPEVGSPRLVSRDGGTEPRWSHSGKELFYRNDDEMVSVSVREAPTLTLGTPERLFSTAGYRAARNRPQYDVAPDDQHFVMIRSLPGRTVDLVWVENWFAELKASLRR
jgi:hypothetical protein